MRNIVDILTEKLHLRKSSNIRNNYLYGDIPEIENNESICPDWAKRKYVRAPKTGQNKEWYTVYCCLYDNGPMTRKEVCQLLQDECGLKLESGVFQAMKENNLIYGEKQNNSREEILHINPIGEWKRQTRGWRYELG